MSNIFDQFDETDTVSKGNVFDRFDREEEDKEEKTIPVLDKNLKVDDIVNTTSYVDSIRDYMIDRKGKQYLSKDKEDVVDDFIAHMRYFNTNEAFTIDEARYISMADKETKERAGKAYQVYDKLGNVSGHAGLDGAVSGGGDYLGAIASSPSTYFGFGIGKGIALAGGKIGAKAVKAAAMGAVRDVLRREGITKAQKKVLAKKAYDDVVKKAVRQRTKLNIGLTGVADASVAGYQDFTLQKDIEMEAGAREDFNYLQTGFSVLGSGLGTGLSIYGATKIPAANQRGLSGSVANKIAEANKVKAKEVSGESRKKYNEEYLKRIKELKQVDYTGFEEMVKAGKKQGDNILYADVLNFVFGKKPVELDKVPVDNKLLGSNLPAKYPHIKPDEGAKIGLSEDIITMAEKAGAQFRPNMNNAQKFAKAIGFLDDETLEQVTEIVQEKFGVSLGRVADEYFRTNLSNRIARSINEGSNILRSVQRTENDLNRALVDGTISSLDERIKPADTKLGKGGVPDYIQNIWKRMLVSAPATTAANVFGFGQYYLANSVAEVLQGGMYMLGGDTQKASALFRIQGRKFLNLLDPYSTLDNYQELLKTDDRLGKLLKETLAGGIEKTAKRFDFDPEGKAFQRTEAVVNLAQTISLVNLQDSLTKSQMFMTSIDKYLRLNKGKTFQETLESGNLLDIDEDVMNRALSDTLRSVFAEDYTKSKSFGGLAGKFAGFVEEASNTPGVGFVLPFGRFMNNVMATAYQWNPVTGGMESAVALMQGRKMDAMEAFSKATVGTAAIVSSIFFQQEQQKKGYNWNELETGTGEVLDITNTFPLSLLMIGGRIGARMTNGETVDKDLILAFNQQIAIAQAATDIQFGNDISRILTIAFNADPEFKGKLPTLFEGAMSTLGNVGAGFTRPLSLFNTLAGYALQETTPYDVTPLVDRRLARGGFEKLGLNGTRYVDNIIEGILSGVNTAVTGETDAVLLGKEKRVASREGSIFDPSPYRSATGQRVKQPRTFANIVFGMVDKPDWKTGMYTGVPEFDNFANQVLAPVIENEAELLLKDERFVKGNSDYKRKRVNQMMNDVKGTLRKYLTAVPDTEGGLLYRKKKLDSRPRADLKRAREITNIKDTSLIDMTEHEIAQLEAALDYIAEE